MSMLCAYRTVDLKQCKEQTQDQWSKKETDWTKESQATQYRKQYQKWVYTHTFFSKLGSEEIVDQSDGDDAPDEETNSRHCIPGKEEEEDTGKYD